MATYNDKPWLNQAIVATSTEVLSPQVIAKSGCNPINTSFNPMSTGFLSMIDHGEFWVVNPTT